MAYTLEALRGEYERLWDTMEIKPEWAGPCRKAAQYLIDNKPRYMTVSGATGVPWFVVAIFHQMECGGNWRGCLHNGDPWNQRTVHVPRGLGPWRSWEDAAIHAMRYDHVDQIKDWCPAQVAFANEKYNGFGSRMRGVPTAYLWSGSNHYSRGKYVSDGVWSASAVSGQAGAMPILKTMMQLDPSISFEDELAPIAAEFPKADKPAETHQEAHTLLKEEQPTYGFMARVLKALGLPATVGGAAVTGSSEAGLDAYAPFLNFFREHGIKIAALVVIAVVIFEAVQFFQRKKAMT